MSVVDLKNALLFLNKKFNIQQLQTTNYKLLIINY